MLARLYAIPALLVAAGALGIATTVGAHLYWPAAEAIVFHIPPWTAEDMRYATGGVLFVGLGIRIALWLRCA